MTCQVTKVGKMGSKIISHQKLLPSNAEPDKKREKKIKFFIYTFALKNLVDNALIKIEKVFTVEL